MAVFTTEIAVREKFQVTDVDKVASSLVTEAMEDAHLEVLRHLEAAYNVDPAADAVVLGETLLSGAHLFRSLAAGEAFQQRDVSVGGQRIQAGRRHASLLSTAAQAEEAAWKMLGPYLVTQPMGTVLAVSDSVAILGE